MFSVTVKIDYYNSYPFSQYIDLRIDGNYVAQIWSDGDDISGISVASGMVVVECLAHQAVWVSYGNATYSDRIYGSDKSKPLFT